MDPSFSFIIAKNHGLSRFPTSLIAVNGEGRHLNLFAFIFSTVGFQSVSIVNPTPFQPLIEQAPEVVAAAGLHVVKCLETEVQYEFDIVVRGINVNLNGISVPANTN